MRRLSLTGAGSALRARRWDVLVLGSALPGLVAAVRLARAGLRVVIVEEEANAQGPLLREPFALPGVRPDGPVQACLRALGVAPIDRHRLEPQDVAYQILLPNARLDVGTPGLTAEEIVSWGLGKPEWARELVTALESASQAECEAMLAAPLVRRSALRALPRTPAVRGGRLRGLPVAAAGAHPEITLALEAQLRTLSNLADSRPPPEASARLLGSALEGGSSFWTPGLSLRALLRRRIEALHGEFRSLASPFELVEVGGHPGIVRRRPAEAWLGRAVLLNAPLARLAQALRGWEHEAPDWLAGPEPTRRRAALQLRVEQSVVPEALARRAILVPDGDPERAVGLALYPSEQGPRWVELIATRVVKDAADALEANYVEMEAAVRALIPFCDGHIERLATAGRPVWDDELALMDPPSGRGWPTEVDIRLSSRPPIFALPREELAALGSEGDLLLGWRGGDALRAELE